MRVFKHELTSKECGLPLPLLHWNQPDNLPITRTICYHIKREFFSLYHTSLSWRTIVFGTESSHCFRNVGGMMCLLRRGYELGPEESSNGVQFFVVVKMEMPTTGNLFPSLFVMISLSVIRLHMVLNVCSFSVICRPIFCHCLSV